MERTPSWLVIACVLAPLSACEIVADFDRQKLDEKRTIGPTPLPTVDGAVAVMPDGSVRPDGALINPVEHDDAGARDAALDAAADASEDAGSAPVDAAGMDGQIGEVDPLEPDATPVIST